MYHFTEYKSDRGIILMSGRESAIDLMFGNPPILIIQTLIISKRDCRVENFRDNGFDMVI